MTINTNDPGVQTVLDNMETIVASEGGSLDIVSLEENQLTVKYNKGINEECPECVPDHAMVKMMIENSLGIYAPHVSLTELL
ncbi:NifU family protein [Chloroflexi bacterium]|nr:NifU family protein [Chloroflexota bacterium]